jgi:hypothetical protein
MQPTYQSGKGHKMAKKTGLSPKQNQAIEALLSARSVQHAGEMIGVSRRSMGRWLKQPEFRTALLAAEGDVIDGATRRLAGLAGMAIDTMAELLTNQETGEAVRQRTAQGILDNMLKLREIRDFDQRLTALEARL